MSKETYSDDVSMYRKSAWNEFKGASVRGRKPGNMSLELNSFGNNMEGIK